MSAATPGTVTVALEHVRCSEHAWTTVHSDPSSDSSEVGRLRPGAVAVVFAEVVVASGERWLRIHNAAHCSGFITKNGTSTLSAPSLSNSSNAAYDLVRRPRNIWPEPVRDIAHADCTFTITFNGRIGPFFEAMGSVLANLGELSMIDSWVVICDRDATIEHRAEILHALPWATIINKGAALYRHPVSMNILLSAFVRTRWWLQWEDDWCLPPGGDVLARAREVAQLGFHQVAVNGAWLEFDPAWGSLKTEKHLSHQNTLTGNQWAELHYPQEHFERVASGREALDALVEGYLAGIDPARRQTQNNGQTRRTLMWPLYSNQPGLNDANFLRKLLPFDESAECNMRGAYWKFEFEFGLRFVRAGGRKATLGGLRHQLARPIPCASSSRPRLNSNPDFHRHPPVRIPMPTASPQSPPQMDSAKATMESGATSLFAGGCSIGTPSPSRGSALETAQRSSAQARVNVEQLLAARGGDVDDLLATINIQGRVAASEKLIQLGYTKVGERKKLEMALARCAS